MPDKTILDITALDKFKELINDQKKLTVVHFWASWANQCAPMDEALKVLAEEVDSHIATFIRVSHFLNLLKFSRSVKIWGMLRKFLRNVVVL